MGSPSQQILFHASSSSFFLLFLSLLVCHQASVEAAQSSAAPVPVRVGVILDLESTPGKGCQTSISMAIEDFYAVNRNFTTRVDLEWRDSKQDVVEAASAAIDLLKNVKVQAIIGPQMSSEAEFVAAMSNKTHVPMLSFTATSPAISPAHFPYFVRTAAVNDSSQVGPITAFISAYGWHNVVPIYDDSDYTLPGLVDALQAINVLVPDRTILPTDATDDHIDMELYRLQTMQTRVFIVHMQPDLGGRLFLRANAAGMMADGYVWIATDSLSDVIDIQDSVVIDAMQGVVGFRPYVPATGKVRDFSTRFRARFMHEHLGAPSIDPTVFQLWAYDTAWAIATATERAGMSTSGYQSTQQSETNGTDLDRLGVSATGPRLLSEVLCTTFNGLVGKFSLVDGQRQLSAFEIINVIGKGARGVGFWTPEVGILRLLNSTANNSNNINRKNDNSSLLRPIIWPGDNTSAPKGWDIPTSGNMLRIAVPFKLGFNQFVNVSDNGFSVTGYCIDVFDAALKKLPYAVRPDYISLGDGSEPYDNLTNQVYLKNFDALVGDTTIRANRNVYVDFTLPYTDSGVSMIVPVKTSTSQSMWIFLEPLTTSLWLGSLAFFFFTGFIVWVIEHRINPEFRGTPWQQFGIIFYFAFSTLVFAHKEKLESNLSRFVVTIWVFVVLILTSSYTASLTSMLTVQQLQPTVTDVNELLRNGDYVGYQDGSFVMGMLIEKLNFDKNKLRNYSKPDQYADALSKGSANGGVAAIFDEIPYLKVFFSQYCQGYTMVGPTYKSDGFGFVFPKGSPLVADVSQAILNVTEGDEMSRIESAWFGDSTACSSQSSRDIGSSSSSLGFHSFGGLFIITGVVSGLMLVIYLVIFIYKERDQLFAIAGLENNLMQKVSALSRHFDAMDDKFLKLRKDVYDPNASCRGETIKDDTFGMSNCPQDMNSASPQEPTLMPTPPRCSHLVTSPPEESDVELDEIRETT